MTRNDNIKNEYIRGAIGVADVSIKVTERRLNGWGIIRRRPLADNGHKTTWKKTKTKDKVNGCCEKGHENGGIRTKDGG